MMSWNQVTTFGQAASAEMFASAMASAGLPPEEILQVRLS